MASFRKTLMSLDDELKKDEVEYLKFLAEPSIRQKKKLQDITEGFQLFQVLEEQSVIAPGRLEFLLECLKVIERHDLIDDIESDAAATVSSRPHVCPFRTMLVRVSEELDSNLLDAMRYLSDIPGKKTITNGTELFTLMMQQKKLSPGNLTNIKEMLKDFNRNDIIDIVEEFEDTHISEKGYTWIPVKPPKDPSNSDKDRYLASVESLPSPNFTESSSVTMAERKAGILAGMMGPVPPVTSKVPVFPVFLPPPSGDLPFLPSEGSSSQGSNIAIHTRSAQVVSGTASSSQPEFNPAFSELSLSSFSADTKHFPTLTQSGDSMVTDLLTQSRLHMNLDDSRVGQLSSEDCVDFMRRENLNRNPPSSTSDGLNISSIITENSRYEQETNAGGCLETGIGSVGSHRGEIDLSPGNAVARSDRSAHRQEGTIHGASSVNISHEHQENASDRTSGIGGSEGGADFNTLPSCSAVSSNDQREALLQNPRDDPRFEYVDPVPSYKMDSEPRGYCLIINNIDFYKDPGDAVDIEMKTRQGSAVDEERLVNTFSRLHFTPRVVQNLTDQQIVDWLRHYQSLDHSALDCFICCILTHGGQGYVYGSNKRRVSVQYITQLFQASACPTLAGKPKLFFLACCQGKGEQGGVIEEDSPTVCPQTSVADQADFLIGYATPPGYASYRSTRTGTWYIEELTRILDVYAASEDLQSLLLMINDAVSKHDYWHSSETGQMVLKKQVSAPQHTLRKKLKFL